MAVSFNGVGATGPIPQAPAPAGTTGRQFGIHPDSPGASNWTNQVAIANQQRTTNQGEQDYYAQQALGGLQNLTANLGQGGLANAPAPGRTLPDSAMGAYYGGLDATNRALDNAFNPYQMGTTGYTAAQAQAYGYNPAQMTGTYGYGAAQAPGASMRTNYNYDPALMQAQGYQAATGQAANVSPASIYQFEPGKLDAQGYGAALQADPSKIYEVMGNYYNPYTENVVNTTMDQMDRNRRIALEQNAAQAAAAGAFGGSRHGVVEAETNRNAMDVMGQQSAQLYNQMFNTAAGLGGQDIGNQINVNTANQNATNRAREFSAQQANAMNSLDAQLASQVGMFNAGQQNNVDLANANLQQNMSLANMDALNNAGAFNSTLGFNVGQANQNAQNRAQEFGLGSALQANTTNANLAANLGMFNAGQMNDASRFGLDKLYGRDIYNAGAQNSAGQFGATALNTTGLANAGFDNAAASYNATNLFNSLVNNGNWQQNAIPQQFYGANQLGNFGQMGYDMGMGIANSQNAAGQQVRGIEQAQFDEGKRLWDAFTAAGGDGAALLNNVVQGNQTESTTRTDSPSAAEAATGVAKAGADLYDWLSKRFSV